LKIFGWDIQRVSKLERQELESYKMIVKELYDRLSEFLDFISQLMQRDTLLEKDQTLNEEACVQMLFERVETICKLIILYDQNKFSIPITSIPILNKMNEMRDHAGKLQNYMIHHVAMLNRKEYVESQYEDEDEYQEEISNIQTESNDIEMKYQRTLQHLLKILFADINRMISVIQYDLFRILFGVDIIRSYHTKCRTPHGRPDYEVKIFNRFDSNKSNGGNQK
jgi:hypothetical protein